MQTKLTSNQKHYLKSMKEGWPGVQLFSFPGHNVTVALERTGATMGHFAVALCGDSEKKFRRKVGEFTAMNRLVDGLSQPIRLPVGCDIEWAASRIAAIVA